jgi:excisionase family DNA binding protein
MDTQILFQGCTLKQLAQELAPLLQTFQVKEENEFITIDEACELLHVKRTSIWKYTKKGKLVNHGIGNRVLYKRQEVLDAIKPINK